MKKAIRTTAFVLVCLLLIIIAPWTVVCGEEPPPEHLGVPIFSPPSLVGDRMFREDWQSNLTRDDILGYETRHRWEGTGRTGYLETEGYWEIDGDLTLYTAGGVSSIYWDEETEYTLVYVAYCTRIYPAQGDPYWSDVIWLWYDYLPTSYAEHRYYISFQAYPANDNLQYRVYDQTLGTYLVTGNTDVGGDIGNLIYSISTLEYQPADPLHDPGHANWNYVYFYDWVWIPGEPGGPGGGDPGSGWPSGHYEWLYARHPYSPYSTTPSLVTNNPNVTSSSWKNPSIWFSLFEYDE